MIEFFQIISAKITAFITVVIITVTSILPQSATNINKPVDTSIATPSATVSEPLSPPTSITPTLTTKAQNKVENEPIPTLTSFPALAPQTISNTFPTSNTQPKTYSIIPLGNISSFPERERVLWANAYNEFLQTSNLQYMDYDQQNKYFLQIVDKYYIQYKQELENEIQKRQSNINQLQQQTQTNLEIEAKLNELKQTLINIQNAPVPMNVIEGRIQRAYQDWTKNNPAIYSAILGSQYINDLNAILRAYGL